MARGTRGPCSGTDRLSELVPIDSAFSLPIAFRVGELLAGFQGMNEVYSHNLPLLWS